MGDLSNKTVALLVVIATIIFFVGITSVPKGGIVYLTGRGTTGVTSYWVQSELTINVTQTAVAFQSGKVETGYNNCTLNSNYTDNATETTGSASAGCVGNWTGYNTRSFIVRNDGTVNVNITVQGTKLAAGFIPTYGTPTVTPEYNFKSYDADGTGACISADLITDWTAMTNATATVICSNLAMSDSTDELSVPIQLVIPDNVMNGTYSDTVTFAAIQSQ
jgi:hypothetical protein